MKDQFLKQTEFGNLQEFRNNKIWYIGNTLFRSDILPVRVTWVLFDKSGVFPTNHGRQRSEEKGVLQNQEGVCMSLFFVSKLELFICSY